MKDKNDKEVALVTGGSRGIGRAIVEALLEEGWVVRFCSRSIDSVEGAKRELAEKYPGRVDGRATDVRSETEVQGLVEWTLESAGRLDCLINKAGVGGLWPDRRDHRRPVAGGPGDQPERSLLRHTGRRPGHETKGSRLDLQ